MKIFFNLLQTFIFALFVNIQLHSMNQYASCNKATLTGNLLSVVADQLLIPYHSGDKRPRIENDNQMPPAKRHHPDSFTLHKPEMADEIFFTQTLFPDLHDFYIDDIDSDLLNKETLCYSHYDTSTQMSPTISQQSSDIPSLSQPLISDNSEIEKKQTICTICHINCIIPSLLKTHMVTHIKDYVCDKTFTTSGSCNGHKKTHDEKNAFSCSMEGCYKKFISKVDLTKHVIKKHPYLQDNSSQPSIQKTFSDNLQTNKNTCPYCNKIFPYRAPLASHIRTHTGEKPYACRFEGCTKRFSLVGVRNRHEKITHQQIRPFFCSICNQNFKSLCNLQHHTKTHMNADKMPYFCHLCKQGFKGKNNFNRHMNMLHFNISKKDDQSVFYL